MSNSKTLIGTALVTGASAGIGATYADRLARRGYDLILVARDAGRMEALAGKLRTETGRKIEVLPADLTKAADLAKIEARLATDPAITLLLNNAGISLNGSLLDNDGAKLEQLIALNITAPTVLASAAGKQFVAKKSGAIVNIASVLAVAPELFDGVYSGSKAYILNLTLGLAEKLQGTGVYAQAVLPGATRTEIWAKSGKDVNAFPTDWVMEVDDLVDAALVGFDKRETVTIPPLADESQWVAYETARKAMHGVLSRRDVAARYRQKIAA
ncbi:SDR family NAD(P)-dependent oxidoreductase [Roseiterribacter gracilis]|uniref:NADP-dependent 3-hydroxy acid dehydrogenase YdfG n=1 Tax=Roseiterribacter gracilis TaxID=2812848 RepID=A0A8S8XLF3_9PROT|nr:short-chain dehydrogenase [Rhodospirillales bacterium TMPK1]